MMQSSFLFLALLALTGSALAASPEGEFQRARQLVAARCALCHGMEGQSVSAEFPRLGGQSPEYFIKQLFLFKTGQRTSNVMQPMADDLSANEIRLLASYFAAQTPPPARADDPELAAVGRYLYFRGNRWASVSACVSCHGIYASGGAQMPRLAGQHASYIENRLRPRLAGPRGQIDLMHSSISAMTEFEIKAVAQYLSGED